MSTKIRTQLLSMDEILGLGWHIYVSEFWKLLLIVLGVYLPLAIISALTRGTPLYQTLGQAPIWLFGVIATMAIAVVVERAVGSNPHLWSGSRAPSIDYEPAWSPDGR